MGQFATGVAVVTAFGAGSAPRGITVNSLTSVSLSPPLILWCLGRGAVNHDTFISSDAFAVHILDESQQDLSNRFAAPDATNWGAVPWKKGRANVPVIEGCETVLECRTRERLPAGDHIILIGEVAAVRTNGVDEPLLFHAGRYRRLSP